MGKILDVTKPDTGLEDRPMKVERIAGGYISDHDRGDVGVRDDLGPFPMTRQPDGVWVADATTSPALADFAPFDHRLYMFRITKDDGAVAYRTDLYSRCQVGFGQKDPKGEPFEGLLSELDGSVSCSAVVDPDRVTE